MLHSGLGTPLDGMAMGEGGAQAVIAGDSAAAAADSGYSGYSGYSGKVDGADGSAWSTGAGDELGAEDTLLAAPLDSSYTVVGSHGECLRWQLRRARGGRRVNLLVLLDQL